MILTLEKRGPALISLIVGGLFVWLAPGMFALGERNEIQTGALYSSVFDIASLSAAFLFSFVTFLKTAPSVFIDAFRKTKFYRDAERYMVHSVIYSVILTLVSVVFLVFSPKPTAYSDPWFWVTLSWAAFSAYTVSAILRSGYHFMAILDGAYSDRFKVKT